MQYAVVYHSQTGSTKKVAAAIAAALPGAVTPQAIADGPSLEGADVVFVGFPIQSFGPAKPAADFLQSACTDRQVALFVTHASPEDAPLLEDWLDKCREAAAGSKVVGLFDCQGELAEPVKQAMLNMRDPELRRWAETDQSQGQPDETRLERAREFARAVAQSV